MSPMYTATYRSRPNGIPVLNKDEIDAIGERLVVDFCPEVLWSPTEIDIDRFVTKYLGFKQDFHYLSHCGVYLGMTVFDDTKVPIYIPEANKAEYISATAGTVIIDNNLLEENQERRYRFTMGHEGSHGYLHKLYFERNPDQSFLIDAEKATIVKCRLDKSRLDRLPMKLWSDSDWIEWQANALASAILMPRFMVRMLLARVPDRGEVDRPLRLVLLLSQTLNVSFEAAEYRLKDLGFIDKDKNISKAELDFCDTVL